MLKVRIDVRKSDRGGKGVAREENDGSHEVFLLSFFLFFLIPSRCHYSLEDHRSGSVCVGG